MSSSLVFSNSEDNCDQPIVELSDEAILRYFKREYSMDLSPVEGVTPDEVAESKPQYKIKILEVQASQALAMDEELFGVLGMTANLKGPAHNYIWTFIQQSGVSFEPGEELSTAKPTKGKRKTKGQESGTAIVEDHQGFFAGEGMEIIRVPFRIKGTLQQLYAFFQSATVEKAEALLLDL